MDFVQILDGATSEAVRDYRLTQQNQNERSGSTEFHYGNEATFVAMLYHNLREKGLGVDNLRLEYEWWELDKDDNRIPGKYGRADIAYNEDGTWRFADNGQYTVVQVEPVWIRANLKEMKKVASGLEDFLRDDPTPPKLVLIVPFLGRLNSSRPSELKDETSFRNWVAKNSDNGISEKVWIRLY